MKIFLDTAQSDDIRALSSTGIIDGVTTNPTHLAAVGRDPWQVVREICEILPDGVISVEVTETDPERIYEQAHDIARLARNVVVKIPCHKDYYHIIERLVKEDIKINITLVFSLIQSLTMCKLGVTYISLFVGRLNDIDVDGIVLLAQMRSMIDTYGFTSYILAASIRDVRHFHSAITAGADAITMPPSLCAKAIDHPLTDAGISQFTKDWSKLAHKDFHKG